jgi:hypothetical protein
MLLATVACLLGASVMLVHAKDRVTRAAHALMLVAMVAMWFAMEHWVALAGLALVLCVAGLALVPRSDEVRRAAAVDVLGCAALLAVSGYAMSRHAATDTTMAGMDHAGMDHGSMDHSSMGSMDMSAAVGQHASGIDGVFVLVLVTLVVWMAAICFLAPRRSALGWGASALMVAGMGTMAAL